jgi:Mrp family chromosome partitioning ATPase
LRELPYDEVPLRAFNTVGISALREFLGGGLQNFSREKMIPVNHAENLPHLRQLVEKLAENAHALIMVMGKGGVGKTTTAVNLAAYLAELGKFVLLVDMDPQANATSGLGVAKDTLEHGIYEALSKQKRLHDIIHNTGHEGLRIAPSTPNLAGANIELVDVIRREHQLRPNYLLSKDQAMAGNL